MYTPVSFGGALTIASTAAIFQPTRGDDVDAMAEFTSRSLMV